MPTDNERLAAAIDHTILKVDATFADVEKICVDAITHRFAAVCVPPYFVKHARRVLEESDVKVATVVGFGTGFSTVSAKIQDIENAAARGAHEVDIVIDLGAVKSGDFYHCRREISRTHLAAKAVGLTTKFIIETAVLTTDEITEVCHICADVVPDFVKTSTGLRGGATFEVVELLRKHLPVSIRIKASGGIRTRRDALRFLDLGADRLGTSSGVRLLEGETGEGY